MAKSDAAETDKKSEGGKKAPRKAFKKRGEKRVVHHGYAHIHASFNNTHISHGDAISVYAGGHECLQRGEVVWTALGGGSGQGPRVGT